MGLIHIIIPCIGVPKLCCLFWSNKTCVFSSPLSPSPASSQVDKDAKRKLAEEAARRWQERDDKVGNQRAAADIGDIGPIGMKIEYCRIVMNSWMVPNF